jgi:hypothetical protein
MSHRLEDQQKITSFTQRKLSKPFAAPPQIGSQIAFLHVDVRAAYGVNGLGGRGNRIDMLDKRIEQLRRLLGGTIILLAVAWSVSQSYRQQTESSKVILRNYAEHCLFLELVGLVEREQERTGKTNVAAILGSTWIASGKDSPSGVVEPWQLSTPVYFRRVSSESNAAEQWTEAKIEYHFPTLELLPRETLDLRFGRQRLDTPTSSAFIGPGLSFEHLTNQVALTRNNIRWGAANKLRMYDASSQPVDHIVRAVMHQVEDARGKIPLLDIEVHPLTLLLVCLGWMVFNQMLAASSTRACIELFNSERSEPFSLMDPMQRSWKGVNRLLFRLERPFSFLLHSLVFGAVPILTAWWTLVMAIILKSNVLIPAVILSAFSIFLGCVVIANLGRLWRLSPAADDLPGSVAGESDPA